MELKNYFNNTTNHSLKNTRIFIFLLISYCRLLYFYMHYQGILGISNKTIASKHYDILGKFIDEYQWNSYITVTFIDKAVEVTWIPRYVVLRRYAVPPNTFMFIISTPLSSGLPRNHTPVLRQDTLFMENLILRDMKSWDYE